MKGQNGSALITIILILSVLVIVATNVLRSTVFAQDIALERQKYEQEYQALRGLMNYTLELSKENFDDFLKKADGKVYNVQMNNRTGNNGVIAMQVNKNELHIEVTKEHKKSGHALQCTLCKKDGHFFVDNWKIT